MRISDADEPGKFYANVFSLIPIIAYPAFLSYRIRLFQSTVKRYWIVLQFNNSLLLFVAKNFER